MCGWASTPHLERGLEQSGATYWVPRGRRPLGPAETPTIGPNLGLSQSSVEDTSDEVGGRGRKTAGEACGGGRDGEVGLESPGVAPPLPCCVFLLLSNLLSWPGSYFPSEHL